MTNETVVAAKVAEKLQAVEQAEHWFVEKGPAFLTDVVIAAIVFLIGWLVIRLINAIIAKAMKRQSSSLFTKFVCSVVSKTCWAMLIVTVLGQLGIDVAPLIAGIGVTGFILGFAFQESLGNLASGLMIALNTPFKVGDYVLTAGFEGTIRELNMMATVLTTTDNKRIVIPNKSIWGGPIVNFSAMAERRVDLTIGIDYGADIAKAKAVALETLTGLSGVLAEPAPMVEVVSLDDSQVTLVLRAWTKNADYWSVYFAANQKVKEAFDTKEIPIPFPQMDVHMV